MKSSIRHLLMLAALLSLSTTAASSFEIKQDTFDDECHTSLRRSWRDLTCDEQDEFLDAIIAIKESGLYDEFRAVHLYYGNLTHSTPEFLPWHRWFLYQFEKALQQVTGKCMYLPYWDSERDAGDPHAAPVFHAETFGTFGNSEDETWCIRDGRFNSISETSLFRHTSFWDENRTDDCLQREYVPWVQLSGESEVLAMIANFEHFANVIDSDGDRRFGFHSVVEGSPHGFPHIMLGGHMGTNYSPDDPLFYLHHANIDRLWSLWQQYWWYDRLSYEDYRTPWHYEGDLLDEPLPFAMEDSTWDFRMYRQFPTPRDLMSNDQPHLSVTYVNDFLSSLLPDLEENPRWFQSAEEEVQTQCRRNTSSDSESWWTRRQQRSLAMGDRVKHLREELEEESQQLRGQTIVEAEPLPQSCQQHNSFTRKEDRDRWNHLCLTMPTNSSVADRLTMMAELDCKERWHSEVLDADASSHTRAVGRWIDNMSKETGIATFECFHRPVL